MNGWTRRAAHPLTADTPAVSRRDGRAADVPFPRWLFWLTLAAASLFFLDVDTGGYWPGWARAVWNSGHVPVLAGVIWALWPWLPGRGLARRWAWGMAAALLIGVAVELVQVGVGGREVSLGDVGLDLAGGWIGLWWASHRRLWRSQRRWAIAVAASVAVIVALVAAPVLRLGVSAAAGHVWFPVLLDGRMPALLERMGPSGDAVLAQTQEGVQVRFADAPFTGFKLFDMPRDWRNFEALVLTYDHSLDHPLALTCRLRDVAHNLQFSDRFNQRYALAAGGGQLAIPLEAVRRAPAGREMDMHDMLEIACFTGIDQPGQTLLIREIRLQ